MRFPDRLLCNTDRGAVPVYHCPLCRLVENPQNLVNLHQVFGDADRTVETPDLEEGAGEPIDVVQHEPAAQEIQGIRMMWPE